MGTYTDENGDLVTYDLTTGDIISTQPAGTFTPPVAPTPVPPVAAPVTSPSGPNEVASGPAAGVAGPTPPSYSGVGPNPSKTLHGVTPIVQGPNGGFYYQYSDKSLSPLQAKAPDLNALQQAELAKTQAETNRILAGGQSASAGAALAGHQLQAGSAAAQLAEQKRQFDENQGFEKAKFNENYAFNQGKELLGLGSRPDTLIKYLYALRGMQTPQAVAGTTNNLPGFGNLATTPGAAPTAQAGAATTGQTPAAAPAAQTPAANTGLQTSPGTQQQLISQELARAGASPQTFASNNLTIPGLGPVNNSAGAQVAHSSFTNPATGQTVAVAGGGALPSTFEWAAPITQAQQDRAESSSNVREARGYAAGGEIGYEPLDRLEARAPAPQSLPYQPIGATPTLRTMPYQPTIGPTPDLNARRSFSPPQQPGLVALPWQPTPSAGPTPMPIIGQPGVAPRLAPVGAYPFTPPPGDMTPRMSPAIAPRENFRGEFFRGGIVPEMVVGVGLHSGQVYTFGEKGPEGVVPTDRLPEDLKDKGGAPVRDEPPVDTSWQTPGYDEMPRREEPAGGDLSGTPIDSYQGAMAAKRAWPPEYVIGSFQDPRDWPNRVMGAVRYNYWPEYSQGTLPLPHHPYATGGVIGYPVPRHYDVGGPIGQPNDAPPPSVPGADNPPIGTGPTLMPPGWDPLDPPIGTGTTLQPPEPLPPVPPTGDRENQPAPPFMPLPQPVDAPPDAGDRGAETADLVRAVEIAADIASRTAHHTEPAQGALVPHTPGRSPSEGDRRRVHQLATGGVIGYQPSSSLSAGLFNNPNLQSVVQRGYNSNPSVPLFPQIDYATNGGQSLLASSQRLNNLLPSERQLYAGTLQDEFGAQPDDVFSLARKLAPQVTGLRTPHFAA